MRKVELCELQNLVYEIFNEFDRICRKYDIQYSMEGGTLLGAVKYGDFVPWDDDIDVIMLRSEYVRFLEVAPQELQGDYFLQSYHNVPSFPLNYAKLCYTKSKICDYDYSHLTSMNHGIFIDIFPIDNVQPEKLKGQLHWIGLLTGARKTKLKVVLDGVPFWKRMCYRMVACLPMAWLCKIMDRTCAMFNAQDTGYCYEVCNSNRHFQPMPSEVYRNLTRLQFRAGEFLAVARYDEFLKSRFGENYMNELPPEEKRKPSHCQNILLER